MTSRKSIADRITRILPLVGVAAVILLVLVRFVRLDVDPPYFFAGYSQADLTDPYHLTHAARNAVLFDTWNLFDFHRWDVFKNSLISGISFATFAVAGVSRVTANIASLILNLGGVALFFLGPLRLRDRREIMIGLLVLLSGAVFFFYSRLPFLENGLIFFSGLLFFTFLRYHDRSWGQFLCGLIVILGALAGKLFGILLLGPVMFSLWYLYRSRILKPALFVIAGAAAGLASYLIMFYGGSTAIMSAYYSEQTIGMYGMPLGLQSPLAFFENLINFGAEFGFIKLAIFPSLLAALGIFAALLTVPLSTPPRKEHLPIIFAGVWIVTVVVGMMPFAYRSMRYFTFLSLPLSALSAYGISVLTNRDSRLQLHQRWLVIPSALLLLWYLFTHLYLLTVPYKQEIIAARRIMPLMLVGAVALTGLGYLYFRKKARAVPRLLAWPLIAGLLIGYGIEQGSYLYRGLFQTGKYLEKYNEELAQMVDGNAVLTGPYAPAFTIDNELRSVIYVFGLSNVQRDLFERFPITHVVADETNWSRAVKDFPDLNRATIVRRFLIRDVSVTLYRLADAAVPLTDFEKAGLFIERNLGDSALFYNERFCRRFPENLSARISLAVSYSAAQQWDKFEMALESLLAGYPDDFRVQIFLSDMYERLFAAGRNPRHKSLADSCNRRAQELNPARVTRSH